MIVEKIRSDLKENPLQDIITVGFTDVEEGVIKYYPDLQWLYFKFEECTIEFRSVEQYSKLQVRFIDEINTQLDIDEDMIEGFSSILNLVLTGGEMTMHKDIKKIRFINMMIKEDHIICDALKIILKNNQMLFLDPSFLHGISIGGIEQETYWKDNFLNKWIYTDIEI